MGREWKHVQMSDCHLLPEVDELGEGGDLGILIENNASKCVHLHFLKSSEGSKNWESKMK